MLDVEEKNPSCNLLNSVVIMSKKTTLYQRLEAYLFSKWHNFSKPYNVSKT